MRFLFFFLFFSSAFAFTTVPQANLVFDEHYPPTLPENTTINSKPQVVFNVLNNGTRTAYILNSSLKTSNGYTVLTAPTSIKPGYTTSFVYEFTNFLCDMGGASFSFETWYAYAEGLYANLTSQNYDLEVSGFLKILNLEPEKEELYVDVEHGDSISFLVKNDANQPINYAFSVEYPDDFFLIFQIGTLELERYDFEANDFFLGPKSSQLFTIQVLPARTVKGSYFRLRVFDKDCPSISQNFEKGINVVWVKDEGFFSRNIVPDISFFGLFLIFFFGFLLFSKVYY